MIPPATREAQATACLEAAERHRQLLLALATKLAKSREAGMDLFQQTLLNCHDAIQRNGFAGERYEFYLMASLKRLHYKLEKQRNRETELPEDFADTYTLASEPDVAARQLLGEQLQAEVSTRFQPADRVALRLHVQGYSCQEIAELTGAPDRWRVRRQLDRIKDTLRETFRQAWESLADPA